ncbi:MAG: Trm112 family protein [bacterium]|nr:Trm112 family protein [bacterium]
MDARLMEILVCPACRGGLREDEADSGLECLECGRIYPIRDGIPVMLVDEASPPRTGSPPDSADT